MSGVKNDQIWLQKINLRKKLMHDQFLKVKLLFPYTEYTYCYSLTQNRLIVIPLHRIDLFTN